MESLACIKWNSQVNDQTKVGRAIGHASELVQFAYNSHAPNDFLQAFCKALFANQRSFVEHVWFPAVRTPGEIVVSLILSDRQPIPASARSDFVWK